MHWRAAWQLGQRQQPLLCSQHLGRRAREGRGGSSRGGGGAAAAPLLLLQHCSATACPGQH
jgi:hypothetical protein